MDISTIARHVYASTIVGNGTTVSLDGEHPADGFVVSLAGSESVITEGFLTPEGVESYILANAEALAASGRYVGAWARAGRVYLDVSEVVPSRREALRIAADNGQVAVFDLGRGREILL